MDTPPQDRALAALKNHKEAEKRRRERINSHLDKLRSLLPCNSKVISMLYILIVSMGVNYLDMGVRVNLFCRFRTIFLLERLVRATSY